MYGGNGSSSTVGGTAAGAGKRHFWQSGRRRSGWSLRDSRQLHRHGSLWHAQRGQRRTTGVLVSTNGSGARSSGTCIAFNGGGASGGEGAGVQINSGTTYGNGNLSARTPSSRTSALASSWEREDTLPIQPPPTRGTEQLAELPDPLLGDGRRRRHRDPRKLDERCRPHVSTLEFFANAARDADHFQR